MLTIRRMGATVVVDLEHGLSLANNGQAIELQWQCRSDIEAEALRQALMRHTQEVVRRTREHEYNQGWKDAKSKRATKQKWFRCFLGT